MIKKIYIFIVILLFPILNCNNNLDNFKKELRNPIRSLKNYNFNSDTAISKRIKTKSDFVLKYLRELDNRKDYTLYIPTIPELKIIKNVIEILPPLQKKLLKKRLLGIYFVNNFLSSGYTEWAVDDDNNFYAFIVFNPRVLKNNISQLITSKELTCFISDDKSYNIEINCGKKYNGFLYILTHEATHLVDYVKNITPYVEPILKNVYNSPSKPFTHNIWQDYFTPIQKYNFKNRKLITFYNMGGGPKIKISEAENTYKDLLKTPFASLYGSLNWAEDLAEFITYYHLTRKLHQPYIIKILKNKKVINKFTPMDSEIVKSRFQTIQFFYQ